MNQVDSTKKEAAIAEPVASGAKATPRPMANPGVPLWSTRYGIVQASQADDVVARSLSKYGEWSEQELDTLSALLDDGGIALQYGAEYGAHALYLSSLVGDRGEVHVVEPRRMEHIALCTAVALNHLRNVYPHHVALGERSGRLELPPSGEQDAERSRVVSLDSLELPNLHLLKINVPGSLMSILGGANEALRQHKPAIYFRLSTMELAATEIAALKTHGYRCWSHLPYLYSPANLSGNKVNIFPGWAHHNVIAVHRDAPAEFEHLPEL
jgi:FkbM family methyltransferase